MPKKRLSENRGLPKRWCLKHGAYYYRVPPGLEGSWGGKKLFRLGKSLNEAYIEWAKHMETGHALRTISELLDRYLVDVIPTKAAKTQTENRKYIKRLRLVFGHFAITDIKPKHIYQYMDRNDKKTKARLEIKLLSHAVTKAVEWGNIDSHPFKGQVRLKGSKPRTRYVEDWEIIEALSLKSRHEKGSLNVIKPYIKIKLLTGMAMGDLLRLELSQIKDDGIHNTRHKTRHSTGKSTIYEWSEDLRAAVDEAIAARPVDISKFLFCTRRGASYVNDTTGETSGWHSMWQRFMKRVMDETEVKERFTEHDLRAKCASDAKSAEHARMLLAHSSTALTQRIYRRKAEKVKPIR